MLEVPFRTPKCPIHQLVISLVSITQREFPPRERRTPGMTGVLLVQGPVSPLPGLACNYFSYRLPLKRKGWDR
jgi:hypothetical protein